MIFDEKFLQELRARNEVRLIQAKEQLGTKWLLHPSNSAQRNDPRNKLTQKPT